MNYYLDYVCMTKKMNAFEGLNRGGTIIGTNTVCHLQCINFYHRLTVPLILRFREFIC